MRTQVKTYTFTAGTRQITVTDDITFAKADIAVIVNRTQQKVLFSIPDYNLITDVTNKVITYDNSLPVLAEGDVLWIEIDIEVTTSKVVTVPGDITVTPIQGQPDYYHDLAYEIGQWVDNDYPYCYAILLSGTVNELYLSGANKYKTSDGQIYTGSQTIIFGANEAGREDKTTRFVIFRTDTPHISFDTTNYPISTNIGYWLIGFYNLNCSVNNLYFYQSSLEFFINDDLSRDPILFNGIRTKQILKNQAFRETCLNAYSFQNYRDDATDSEKTVELVNGQIFYFTQALNYIKFPEGTLVVNFGRNTSSFVGTTVKVFPFPDSVKEIYIQYFGITANNSSGRYMQLNWPHNLEVLYIGGYALSYFRPKVFQIPDGLLQLTLESVFCPYQITEEVYIGTAVNFSNINSPFGHCVNLKKIEIGDNWSFSVFLNGSTNVNRTGSMWTANVFNKLLDLHSTNNVIPYVKITTGALTVWEACDSAGNLFSANGDSAKFDTLFRVGQIVIVNISGINRSYTIQSIDSDNQMTMTASTSMIAGTYILNHNKVVTLNSTDYSYCSASDRLVATNKLWQIATA